MDSSDNPHISYYDFVNNDLRYAFGVVTTITVTQTTTVTTTVTSCTATVTVSNTICPVPEFGEFGDFGATEPIFIAAAFLSVTMVIAILSKKPKS